MKNLTALAIFALILVPAAPTGFETAEVDLIDLMVGEDERFTTICCCSLATDAVQFAMNGSYERRIALIDDGEYWLAYALVPGSATSYIQLGWAVQDEDERWLIGGLEPGTGVLMTRDEETDDWKWSAWRDEEELVGEGSAVQTGFSLGSCSH